MFEVRVVIGRDPASGCSVQRSFTIRGDRDHAERRRIELVADFGIDPRLLYASGLTVRDLLTRWVRAGHTWKPSTLIAYTNCVAHLTAEPIGAMHLRAVTPQAIYRTVGRWQEAGVGPATVSGRTKTLGAAFTWAVEQGVLRSHPLAGMRRPAQPLPRLPLPIGDVELLLRTASKLVADARSEDHTLAGRRRLFEAEQTELLTRIAADSGARRGELAALRIRDLEDRVLHICRNISGPSTVTTPKGNQYRTLTLGQTTVDLWFAHTDRWPRTSRGSDWLFSASADRYSFVQPRGLAGRFERLRILAGVPEASLHRLRHTVAVVLVADGKLLAAQHRLGHRDLSTTLRHYGWAQAPDDTAIADHLDTILGGRPSTDIP